MKKINVSFNFSGAIELSEKDTDFLTKLEEFFSLSDLLKNELVEVENHSLTIKSLNNVKN